MPQAGGGSSISNSVSCCSSSRFKRGLLLLALRSPLLQAWQAMLQFWSVRLGWPALQTHASLPPPSHAALVARLA